ncbi:hypothetical protein CKO40_22785 [Halochromatium glycolicum]|uniref:dTDP-4-dehydro-6-deoxy-alpha-D-glucopyranose 2,3-dehydratase domain-containing protein n=2 Tax=Halochromatium glycolicum TaxID=85075 RepID=A0AAJ0U8R9_9GAMM|nr:hypothetical protein [Halochromatium glycolicum]
MLLHLFDGEPHLLQARVEPGNSGIGQYGPTVQSTPANYLRIHGGKETPYLDYFMSYRLDAKPLLQTHQVDLGVRYFRKSKTLSFIEVPNLLPTIDNMIWVPVCVLLQLVQKNNFFNTDLRSMVGVFDWSAYRGKRPNFSSIQCNELPRSSSQCWFLPGYDFSERFEITAIAQTGTHEIVDDGVRDLTETGVAATLYRVACTNREVRTWHQPLMTTAFRSAVTQYIRETTHGWEFLLSMVFQMGFNTRLYLTSFLKIT